MSGKGVRAWRGEGANSSWRAGFLRPGQALESAGSFEILLMPRPHADQLTQNGAQAWAYFLKAAQVNPGASQIENHCSKRCFNCDLEKNPTRINMDMLGAFTAVSSSQFSQ